MDAAYSHCENLVRQADKDRFLASLFAPADKRRHLFALYAFNIELSRVRAIVSDPLPGEMRYQWWHDALNGAGHGNVQSHPVAHALLDTIARCALPADALQDFIEARTFDLYDDPMPTIADLDRYGRETSGVLIRMACLVLANDIQSATTKTIDHAGCAYAICGILRALHVPIPTIQAFLPCDIMRKHGVQRDDLLAGHTPPTLAAALADVRALATTHVAEVRLCANDLPIAIVPAILPVCLVDPYLKVMETARYRPLATALDVPQWKRQWILWRAARRAGKRCREN